MKKRRRRRQNPIHTKLLRDNRHLYEEMLKAQGGHCALCPRRPKPTRRLDMDHNHKTMKIRGLLCVPCNRTVRDWMTPEWAEKLKKYLKEDK
jgi:hypothetical protein